MITIIIPRLLLSDATPVCCVWSINVDAFQLFSMHRCAWLGALHGALMCVAVVPESLRRGVVFESRFRTHLFGFKMRYDTIRYNKIQYNTTWYDMIRYDTIQHDTIRYLLLSKFWSHSLSSLALIHPVAQPFFLPSFLASIKLLSLSTYIFVITLIHCLIFVNI